MRLPLALCAPLALAAALAGCASNAAPLPAEDAQLDAPDQVRAVQPPAQAEGEDGAALPSARNAAATQAADAAPAVAAVAPLQSVLRGTVGGHALAPTYNFFMRGRMEAEGRPDVLILVQTDNPELCAHLGAGTMPRSTSMFAVALMREDGKTLPRRGTFLAPIERGPDAPRHAMAFFRHLDEACNVSPLPTAEGAVAEYGSAELLQLRDGESAQVRYSFKFNTDDVVEGEIDATYCAAPKLFAAPTAMVSPEVDPEDCR